MITRIQFCLGISALLAAMVVSTPCYAAKPSVEMSPLLEQEMAEGPDDALFRIVVGLEPAETLDARKLAYEAPDALADLKNRVARAQMQVLSDPPAGRFRMLRRYEVLYGFSAEADRTAIHELRSRPEVRSLELMPRLRNLDSESHPLTGINVLHELGFDGTGVTVAVIDDAIDADHPAFGGSSAWPNAKIIGGTDISDNDSDPRQDCVYFDHGTAVTGVLAGDGGSIVGTARDSKIVFVKIKDSQNCVEKPSTDTADITAAIDWIIANRTNFNPDIRIISISQGSFIRFSSEFTCSLAYPSANNAVNEARAAGLTIFAASGNDGDKNDICAPACLAGVISVGSVWDIDKSSPTTWGDSNNPTCTDENVNADDIPCYSNSAGILDLLAPGPWSYTASTGGGIDPYFSGTSASAPFAAGVAASLLEAADLYGQALSPDQLRDLMVDKGTPIYDARNGLTFPRVNAYSALLELDSRTYPKVASVGFTSLPNTNIQVVFSEPIRDALVAGGVSITGSQSGLHSFGFSYSQSNYSLQINPYTDFTRGETVSVNLSTAIVDLAGNSLDGDGDGDAGPGYSFSFQIEAEPSAPPTSVSLVANVSPNSGVPPYSPVTVSGTATYNTGSPVLDGTVTISTSNDVFTASVQAGAFSRVINAPPTSGNIVVRIDESVYDLSAQLSRSINITGTSGGSGYTLSACDVVYDVVNHGDSVEWWSKNAFRSDDNWVRTLVFLEDIYEALDLSWKYYRPDGAQYGSTQYDSVPDPGDYGYLYWYWEYRAWGLDLDGYSAGQLPGLWTSRIWIDGALRCQKFFSVQYNLTEHLMAENVSQSAPYNPINPTNTFYQNSARAYTWANLDWVAEGLDQRWDWYEPDGSLYSTYPYTISDPSSQGHVEWSYYRTWGYIDIAGSAAASRCGNWGVDVFIRNAATSLWEKVYTDSFTILEQPNVDPQASVTIVPEQPLDSDSIQLSVSAADNTLLEKVSVHWRAGSWHSTEYSDLKAPSFSKSISIGSLSGGSTLEAYVVAEDTSGNVYESEHQIVQVLKVADLSVDVSDSADPLDQGDSFQYTITVGNSGPSVADQVRLEGSIASGLQISNVTGSGWNCSVHEDDILCTRPSLDSGSLSSVSISVSSALAQGTVSSGFSVSSVTTDLNLQNNTVGETTQILVPDPEIFSDGFESGRASAWSATQGYPGISISSISPPSVTVNPGSSESISVTIARTSYAGNVSLAIWTSDLPAGVTASYSHPGTGNTGTITLTAGTSCQLVTDSTTTVRASGTDVSTATKDFALTVQNPPGISSISLNPTSLRVNPGSSRTTSVWITRENGFTGFVSLLIPDSLPSGVTASFVHPGTGNTGSVTISAGTNCQLTTKTVRVRGSAPWTASKYANLSITTTVAKRKQGEQIGP